jgi:RNA polymerase sigma-70 factor (ECF subfamily)
MRGGSVTVLQSAQFDALVAAHRVSVERVCRSILRDDDLVADAAQEAFVRLWRQLELGAEPDQTAAWLRKVALTTSLDLARRRDARARAEHERRVPADAAAPDHASPPERAANAELEAQLERALRDLPEGQRTVFVLRHRGGLGLAEVAATLGVELSTVKTQFARAALRLQARLQSFRSE